jgi:hypothetical protein
LLPPRRRYPDTPGAYPASKTNWYWSNGGLYDQAHVPGYTTTASYSKAPIGNLAAEEADQQGLRFAMAADPNSADFAWQRGYTWLGIYCGALRPCRFAIASLELTHVHSYY